MPGGFEHAPDGQEVAGRLFAEAPLEWNRLPHFQVRRGTQWNGLDTSLGRIDLEDRNVFAGLYTDHGGRVAVAVVQRDREAAGAIDDVVIGDDVALGVPDEARAGPRGALEGLAGPEVAHDLGLGDEDRGGCDRLEDVNGVALVL